MSNLSYISIFSIVIPLTIGFLQWRKLPETLMRIQWLLVISLLSDILCYLAGCIFKNSFPVVNLFSLIEFLFLAYVFSGFYRIKRVVWVVCGVYLTYFTIDILFYESPLRLLTNANVLGMLLIVILLIYYMYNQLIDQRVMRIQQEPIFWIAFAFLLYYSGSLFVILAYNHIIALSAINKLDWSIWDIHNLFNILKNSIIAVALWLNYKATKSPLCSEEHGDNVHKG